MPWSVLQKKPRIWTISWTCYNESAIHTGENGRWDDHTSSDSKGNNEEKHSIQPMGSQFEQMSFLIFDAIVLKLMENWNQTSEQMFMRHADLE